MYSFIYYIQSIMPPATTTTLALPFPHAHFIWYCAWLAIPSAIYAYSHPASTHLAIIPASVWATSLLYWRNPLRDSWRRTLDMVAVFTGLSYNTYYAVQTISHASPNHFGVYAALIGTSAVCYSTSNYLMARGHIWPATYAHASVHLVGNMANMVLYNGVKSSNIIIL
jgi:hypothetical protein